MKLSVSLTDEDVAALDRYVDDAGLRSRSAGVQRAIRQVAQPDLADDYAAAWDEWETSGEATAWEATTADGDLDAPR